MKKRIMVLLLLFLPAFALSIDQYVINDDGTVVPTGDLADQIQQQADLSQIKSELKTIKAEMGSVIKQEDIGAIKSDFFTEADFKINSVIQKMLMLLIVVEVFTFAIVFLFKSKGWF